MTSRSREAELVLARRAAEQAALDAEPDVLGREHPAPINPLAEEVARRRQRANARVADHYPTAPEPTDPAA